MMSHEVDVGRGERGQLVGGKSDLVCNARKLLDNTWVVGRETCGIVEPGDGSCCDWCGAR
jgi:hypothetical protein